MHAYKHTGFGNLWILYVIIGELNKLWTEEKLHGKFGNNK